MQGNTYFDIGKIYKNNTIEINKKGSAAIATRLSHFVNTYTHSLTHSVYECLTLTNSYCIVLYECQLFDVLSCVSYVECMCVLHIPYSLLQHNSLLFDLLVCYAKWKNNKRFLAQQYIFHSFIF